MPLAYLCRLKPHRIGKAKPPVGERTSSKRKVISAAPMTQETGSKNLIYLYKPDYKERIKAVAITSSLAVVC